MRTLFLESAIAVLLVTLGPPVAAQQATSEIRGRVADQSGALVPSVAIILTNEDTGAFRETTAGPDGTYLAPHLVPGRYRIVAKMEGFRTLHQSGLLLELGATLTANLTLEIGPRQETVTVKSATPLIDLASTHVGGNIGTAELTQLPAMDRSYFATVALLPGVQFTSTPQMGDDAIIASGQAAQNNSISIDGAMITSADIGSSNGIIHGIDKVNIPTKQ